MLLIRPLVGLMLQGSHTHVHVIVPARRATGHASKFAVDPGATLWLPVGAGG